MALFIVLLFYVAYRSFQGSRRIEYAEHLDDVAVTVDGEDLTLADLMFYVLYEERTVEEQAEIYHPENTKDYWNAHINGIFIQSQVKDIIMGMAVHDRIFYRQATDAHMALSTDAKTQLEDARTDFWADLYDIQMEKLPTDYETVNRTMREIAYAQMYQQALAEELGTTYSGLNWDGYDYKQLLEEHDVRVNDRIWDRIIIGDITLEHTRVNYINGWDDEDEKQE